MTPNIMRLRNFTYVSDNKCGYNDSYNYDE